MSGGSCKASSEDPSQKSGSARLPQLCTLLALGVILLLVQPVTCRPSLFNISRAASAKPVDYTMTDVKLASSSSDMMAPTPQPWHGKRYAFWEKIKKRTPRTYNVPHINPDLPLPEMNGDPEGDAWRGAEWSEEFVDIEGSPPRQHPRYFTSIKMLWQSETRDRAGGLWVAAMMKEPLLMGTCHTPNLPIFKYDHDFEIFINCDGSTHNYFEFEMNARNITWQLKLPKPYSEGGNPVSPQLCPGLKSHVFLKGKLDDPSAHNVAWSTTIFIPFEGMAAVTGQNAAIPSANDFWRLSFSRVELPVHVVNNVITRNKTADGKDVPEDNWTWSPQGVVDMHVPQRWPFIVFTDKTTGGPAGPSTRPPDPYWIQREYLTRLFQYQHDFYSFYNKYAEYAEDLIDDQPELTKQTKIVPNNFYWIATLPLDNRITKWMSINVEGLTLLHNAQAVQ